MAHAAPPPRRVVPVVAAAGLVAGLVAGAAEAGIIVVVVAVAVLQIAVAGGLVVLANAPAPRQSVALSVSAAIVADVLLVRGDTVRLGDLVGVVALALVVAVLLELLRRDRVRVTASLAVTLTGVVLVVFVAHLFALHALERGDRLMLIGYACVAGGLLIGWLVSRVVSAPAAVLGATALTGGALGAVIGSSVEPLQLGTGAVLGCGVALPAAIAMAMFSLAVAEAGPRIRDLARPFGAVLPCVVAAPVAYAVSLLLVG